MHVKLPSVERRNHLHFPDLNDLNTKQKRKFTTALAPPLSHDYSRGERRKTGNEAVHVLVHHLWRQAELNKYNPRKLTWMRRRLSIWQTQAVPKIIFAKQNLFTAYHTLHNPKSKLPLKLNQEKKRSQTPIRKP